MSHRLYAFKSPSRATRISWALEEAGADWELVPLAHDAPELLAVSPLGKVPALETDGQVLRESGAILFMLGERYPDSGLIPADPQGRALCLQWMLFVLTEMEQACWLKAKHRFALPAHLRVPGVEPAAQFEFVRCAELLEAELAGRPFLVGDRFTAADLLGTHTLMWGRRAGFPISDGLSAWAATHLARPAYARAAAREAAVR